MNEDLSSPLISPKALYSMLNHPDLILLDASMRKNKSGKTSPFENQKIVKSRYFDIKHTFSDRTSNFPNTFPSESQFKHESQQLGINNSSLIVIYDNLGIYTSPRVWWMFKTMGHNNVFVLNGGLPAWIHEDYPTTDRYSRVNEPGDFVPALQKERVKSFQFIQANLTTLDHQVIDARSPDRFNGFEEPRKGLRAGNIPHSINLHYDLLLADGKYKSQNELKHLFDGLKLDNRPIIFSCGSGVTACILLLAAEMVLENHTSIYDGSWTEWGSLYVEDAK